MRIFKDNAGRSWSVSVNVETMKRLRTALKVDLMELVEREPGKSAVPRKPLLERLLRDPVLLADVLYVACKDEADRQGISDVEFGQALAGGAIAAARTALLEEIGDFFPDEGSAIRSQVAKISGAYRKLIQQVDLRIQGYSEEELVEAALAAIAASERGLLPPRPGTSSTSWPASAESTPTS